MTNRKERKDAAEHRRIILQKAQELFAAHGVDGVSMHQIAKSAGVGQGTLYRRYAHKGDLCLDLMQEICRQVQENLERYLHEQAARPVRERIETILRQCLDFIEEKSQLVGAVQAPGCEEGRSFLYRSPFYTWLHGAICNLLEEAARKDDLLPVDPVYAADAMLSSVSPDLYLFLRRGRGLSKDDIAQNFGRLYLDRLFRES